MKSNHRSSIKPAVITIGVLAALVAGAVGFVHSGLYDVGADAPHLPITSSLLGQLRQASIHKRAAQLTVPPDLNAQARVIQGAGNYDAMCTQCHLAPGMQPTELSRGLYPAPPNLSRETVDAAEAFWAIKHGIKASGMPAWGASMDDEYIWNMAAFVQQLPKLDAAGYRALVAKSGGHSHGGGETGRGGHHHGGGTTEDHHGEMPGTAEEHGASAPHAHAPGTPTHDDPAPPHTHAPGTPPHEDAAPVPAGHTHAAGTPPHDDTPPAHVDPPGTPPHSH